MELNALENALNDDVDDVPSVPTPKKFATPVLCLHLWALKEMARAEDEVERKSLEETDIDLTSHV